LENVLIEVMLQLFVGIIDAQLFETVAGFEIFKAKYVQYTYTIALVISESVLFRKQRVVHLQTIFIILNDASCTSK